jgi:hypothetical protein
MLIRTEKTMTQKQRILQLLRAFTKGVSSYDFTYNYGIKQAPARIWELIHRDGFEIGKRKDKFKKTFYFLKI